MLLEAVSRANFLRGDAVGELGLSNLSGWNALEESPGFESSRFDDSEPDDMGCLVYDKQHRKKDGRAEPMLQEKRYLGLENYRQRRFPSNTSHLIHKSAETAHEEGPCVPNDFLGSLGSRALSPGIPGFGP